MGKTMTCAQRGVGFEFLIKRLVAWKIDAACMSVARALVHIRFDISRCSVLEH
jgi:hypothetical protein